MTNEDKRTEYQNKIFLETHKTVTAVNQAYRNTGKPLPESWGAAQMVFAYQNELLIRSNNDIKFLLKENNQIQREILEQLKKQPK